MEVSCWISSNNNINSDLLEYVENNWVIEDKGSIPF